MARPKKNAQPEAAAAHERITTSSGRINLSAMLSTKPDFQSFEVWIVGDTPLITHAWSHKAKLEMLQKQVKATKGAGREAKNPEADFISSLYEMGKNEAGEDQYGFPATGFKNCVISAAHKDFGVAKTAVMSSLWIDAEMTRVRPARAGAICDMPLVRIHGTNPEMREDMVKVGAGLNKTANLAYRGQFKHWGIRITGRYDSGALTPEQIGFLISRAGTAFGLGEWRNEKKGMFGAFHLATPEEMEEWDAFARGEGDVPVSYAYKQAAE